MLVDKDIQQMLSQLKAGNFINVPVEGADVIVRFLDQASKLSLSALVYEGGNYIPKSVRNSLSHKSPFFHPSILTFITVDEQNFQVKLNYLGQTHSLNKQNFKELLEEFGVIAGEWRLYLDEHGKNDLIHVRVK